METTKANEMVDDQQLGQGFDSIKKAVQGEREDELFYNYLISQAPTSEEKGIISSIRDDERRHNILFRRIYEDFAGEKIPQPLKEESFKEPVSYLDGIKKALFGELSAVERYRAIRRNLPIGSIYIDILFDIITDELKHASKYNYLFTLNSNKNTETAKGGMTNTQATNEGNTNMQETNEGNTSTQTTNEGTAGNSNMNTTNSNMSTTANTNTSGTNAGTPRQNTANYTPDEWVKYITPLVTRALAEAKEGINPEHLYQEFILAGVLVGLGKKPQEAIEQVESWEKTGTSKLLVMSKMNRYFDILIGGQTPGVNW